MNKHVPSLLAVGDLTETVSNCLRVLNERSYRRRRGEKRAQVYFSYRTHVQYLKVVSSSWFGQWCPDPPDITAPGRR